MALIKCPECKKKISDQCGNCPHCGYPINSNVENVVTETLGKTNLVTDGKRPFYKTVWFWIVVGVVAITAIVTTVFLLVRDTKPKYDKEGNPIFVELTNEVYTNAKDYLGYHINIKGKVFQVMGDNGTSKGIQIWLDPDTCEQNLMIYYTSDIEVKQDDYIMCSGYIDSVTKYKNAYDAELHVPLVYSTDLKKATYIDVMAPTTETVTPENLKQEKFGYSVSIDKIEFSEKETRVYATVTNNGKALMNVGDAVIVQDGKQYNSECNYEANYDGIPYEIVKGASSSGIIVFPPISNSNFELTIDVHSDDYDEELGKFVFKVSKENKSSSGDVSTPSVEEESSSTSTQTSKPSNVSNQTTDNKNRNAEAVSEAEEWAQYFYPTDRYFMRDLLINPSLEQGYDGFTDAEADYALQNANIDWKKHAVEQVTSYIGGSHIIPSSVTWYFSGKYTDAEIQYAMNNCGVDWNNAAAKRAGTLVSDKIITKPQVVEALLSEGFTKLQSEYGINNGGIDWSQQVYYYVSNMNDKWIDYSWCDNCGQVFGVHDSCPFCGGNVKTQGAFGYTKNEVKSKLSSAGFTNAEIEEGLKGYDDRYFYDENNYRKP